MREQHKAMMRWLLGVVLLIVCAAPLWLLGTSNILSSDGHSIFFLGMSGEYWTAGSRQFAACMVLAAVAIIATLVISAMRPDGYGPSSAPSGT
jgi:hypothetical protein